MHGEFGERVKFNLSDLEEDYLTADNTVFAEDEEMDKLKNVVKNELSDFEKRMILLYTEIGSQRKLASLLGCSPSTICKFISQIRTKITEKLKDKK